jgi:LPS export ABC transporter protein LptC
MSMARLRKVLVAACVVAGLFVAVSCNQESPPAPGSKSGPFPDQILSEFKTEMTKGELRSALIQADKGVLYRKRDSMLLTNLVAKLYDAQGNYSSTLVSDSGLLRERQQRMIANGNVKVDSRDSLHLNSDSLFWYGELSQGKDSAASDRYMVAKGNVYLVTRDSVQLWTDTLLWNDISRRVATDAFVTIVRQGLDTLRGIGLRSDDQLERITIQERVSGTMREHRK